MCGGGEAERRPQRAASPLQGFRFFLRPRLEELGTGPCPHFRRVVQVAAGSRRGCNEVGKVGWLSRDGRGQMGDSRQGAGQSSELR